MKYLMTFSYDGTAYEGYQIQKNKNTIQKVIEEKLTMIHSNQKVTISASGRTDKGVHALNQKAHFMFDKNINSEVLKNSLNKLLPKDIYVKNIITVNDDFHARFDVIQKEYEYKINLGEYNPIQHNYIFQYNKQLDIEAMEEAAIYLKGTRNFKAFTKVDEEKESYVRTIYQIDFELTNDILNITFVGNGFLRYMVRNIVGTLINVGEHKLLPNDIKEILNNKDRKKAGIKAPASGLYLKNVYYEHY